MRNSAKQPAEAVNHPSHYTPGPFEVYKVLMAWGLDKRAHLWNVVKYVARCGKKGREEGVEGELENLRKARWYLDLEIGILEGREGKYE